MSVSFVILLLVSNNWLASGNQRRKHLKVTQRHVICEVLYEAKRIRKIKQSETFHQQVTSGRWCERLFRLNFMSICQKRRMEKSLKLNLWLREAISWISNLIWLWCSLEMMSSQYVHASISIQALIKRLFFFCLLKQAAY